MKKILLIGGLLALGFVACKKDDNDDSTVPAPLPTFPTGQYKISKVEFRDTNNQVITTNILPPDSSMYCYYNALGQFTKAVRVHPTECNADWAAFIAAGGSATYDSTQFFPSANGLIMYYYLGFQSQGFLDYEYMRYYLTKTNYLPADTVTCN